jgi:hypothetical protein
LPAHRISQHRRRAGRRDLEVGAVELSGSDGAGTDRAGKAHLTIRAMREEQWRRDRAVDGRGVPEFVENRHAEVPPRDADQERENDGLGVVVLVEEEVERPGRVRVRA